MAGASLPAILMQRPDEVDILRLREAWVSFEMAQVVRRVRRQIEAATNQQRMDSFFGQYFNSQRHFW